MSVADQLYHLQAIDHRRDSERLRLAEVERTLGDSADVKRARQRLEAATTLAQRQTARQTDLELKLQGLIDKTTRETERLYGGSVRNPKQLEELQAEVASLGRRQAAVEDDLLLAMIESEEADAALREARELLASEELNLSSRLDALGAERLSLKQSLARMDEERAALVSGMSAADIAAYESLRSRKGGTAVAAVAGGICTACGVALSANRKWHLREGNLVNCANCERIFVIA